MAARFTAILLCGLLLVGCGPEKKSGYSTPAAGIEFNDNAETNAELSADKFDLKFVDRKGTEVKLSDHIGKKNLVLVVTRGFSGDKFCPFCSAQTSRLIANHQEFESRGAEVLVVYPGAADKAEAFAQHVAKLSYKEPDAIPFELLIDPDLAAVDKLDIRADLAKPSTYILDKEGKVRFAYVGSTMSDRPSLKAMLAQLDRIEK